MGTYGPCPQGAHRLVGTTARKLSARGRLERRERERIMRRAGLEERRCFQDSSFKRLLLNFQINLFWAHLVAKGRRSTDVCRKQPVLKGRRDNKKRKKISGYRG